MVSRLELIGVEGIGEIQPGDALAPAILGALASSGESLRNGDVLVVTHKVISKAEGRIAKIASEEEVAVLLVKLL